MERLFGEPLPMLEVIWQHEQAALPLATPEDKAGLKARLFAHADIIADTDIRALYRRELGDRFSAFAFPRRDRPQPARSNATTGRRSWNRPVAAPLAPARTAELQRAAEGGGRDTLAHAVLAGLARFPGEIQRHAEALLRLAAAEPRHAEAIDVLFDHAPMLEGARGSPISAPGILAPPSGSNLYSFLVEGHDADEAREDLAEAITLLVERPALEAAIAEATARFGEDPEGAFAEQQRLRKRKLEIEARLGQLARKRAALAALEDNTATGAYRSTSDETTD